jgi:hypothetical protein
MFPPLLAGCLPCWTRAAKKGRSPSRVGPGPYKKAQRNRWLLQDLFRCPLGLVGARAPTLRFAARLAARLAAGPLLGGSSRLLNELLGFFSYLRHAPESRSFPVGGYLDTYVLTPRTVIRNLFIKD